MTKSLVLVIEDDSIISCLLTKILCSFNYSVIVARSGNEALNIIASRMPDVILLDLGLPDMDGTEVIRSVREWSAVPIIVVSARDHGQDKVIALDLGADDYVTKQFDTSELLARIRTAIRHSSKKDDSFANNLNENSYHSGNLKICYETRRISVGDTEIHLTQNEYKIIYLLSRNAGKVLTHRFIISNVWGNGMTNDNKILRVNMANIRKKLNENSNAPEFIFTEAGIGYRMAEADEA